MTSQTLLDWHETSERCVEPVGWVGDVEGFASEGVHFGRQKNSGDVNNFVSKKKTSRGFFLIMLWRQIGTNCHRYPECATGNFGRLECFSAFSANYYGTWHATRLSLEGATKFKKSMNEDCVEHCHGHGEYTGEISGGTWNYTI